MCLYLGWYGNEVKLVDMGPRVLSCWLETSQTSNERDPGLEYKFWEAKI